MLWSKTGLKYQKFLPKQPKSFQRKDIYNQSSKIVSSTHCGFHFEMNFLSWDLKASWPAWPCKEFVVEKTFATNSLNVQANLQSAKPLLALKLKQTRIQKIDQHWVENVNKKQKGKWIVDITGNYFVYYYLWFHQFNSLVPFVSLFANIPSPIYRSVWTQKEHLSLGIFGPNFPCLQQRSTVMAGCTKRLFKKN